jgi:hypothetical protein
MAFILDHLTAVLVGAVLLGALLVVQVRQQRESIVTTQRHGARVSSAGFIETVQRDVENLRTPDQAVAAFGATRFVLRRATGSDGETYTSHVSFPTLKDPALGSASPVVVVGYVVEPSGATLPVGPVVRPLYQVTRYEYARAAGALVSTGTTENVVDFDVAVIDADGDEIWAHAGIPDMPMRARLSVSVAPPRTPGPVRGAAPTAPVAVRFASVVEIAASGATAGLPPVESGPSGVPAFPDDAAP